MKFFYLSLATSFVIGILSCSNSKNTNDRPDEDDIIERKNKDVEDEPTDKSAKIAAAYCDCYTENTGDPSTKLRKIILKVSEMDVENLPEAMNDELMKIDDAEARTQLADEFVEWAANKRTISCMNDVKERFGIAGGGSGELADAVYKKMKKMEDCSLLATFLEMKRNARKKGESGDN